MDLACHDIDAPARAGGSVAAARRRRSADAKRGFDIVAGCCLLILSLPALATASLLIRLTSRGPCLFWSERVGRDGRAFALPKLRTMRVGAPLAPRETMFESDAVTPIGGWLRRTSLDELPQLWCVVWGDMSLVGPRPLLAEDDGVRERARLGYRHTARPGLTGLAQIRGRNRVSPRRKALYDRFYAEHTSLGLDAKILAATVRKVIQRADVL
ncbi:MAG: sugar transferase [Pseudomonadota bacterium]